MEIGKLMVTLFCFCVHAFKMYTIFWNLLISDQQFTVNGNIVEAIDQNICDQLNECKCSVKVRPWITVNCEFAKDRSVDFKGVRVPENVVEMAINQSDNVIIKNRLFDTSRALEILSIMNVNNLVFEKESFYSLTTPSLLIQIENCARLEIKTDAFKKVQSSISLEIKNCESIIIQGGAFNKLQKAEFKDTKQLYLSPGAFFFANNANFGHQGPITSISFVNVTISEILENTFRSALADVSIQNSEIGEINSDAFRSPEIASIFFANTRIGSLKTASFNEKMLIFNFKLDNCSIKSIESSAISAGITKLTLQHSKIGSIYTGGFNSTIAHVIIEGNRFAKLHTASFVLQNLDRITVERNRFEMFPAYFVQFTSSSFTSQDSSYFTFQHNQIDEYAADAFDSFSAGHNMKFTNNSLNSTCTCTRDSIHAKPPILRAEIFCTIDSLLSHCFHLKIASRMSVEEFAEYCTENATLIYTNCLNEINTIKLKQQQNEMASNWFYLTMLILFLIISIVVIIITLFIFLLRSHSKANQKNEVTNTTFETINNSIVADMDEDDENYDENQFDISEYLSIEFLQNLHDKLDDPSTHDEATQLIEQLYEKYIRNLEEDFRVATNKEDEVEEENHFYEELGGSFNVDKSQRPCDLDRNSNYNKMLRIIKERISTNSTAPNELEEIINEDGEKGIEMLDKSDILCKYSQPSDAEFHLYSEVQGFSSK